MTTADKKDYELKFPLFAVDQNNNNNNNNIYNLISSAA